MPRPKRVESPENKTPRGVTVIWEYCPDVKRQAAALLHLLGVGTDDTSTSTTPRSSPERGDDKALGRRSGEDDDMAETLLIPLRDKLDAIERMQDEAAKRQAKREMIERLVDWIRVDTTGEGHWKTAEVTTKLIFDDDNRSNIANNNKDAVHTPGAPARPSRPRRRRCPSRSARNALYSRS